jgi:hypothetical protein
LYEKCLRDDFSNKPMAAKQETYRADSHREQPKKEPHYPVIGRACHCARFNQTLHGKKVNGCEGCQARAPGFKLRPLSPVSPGASI